jgi:hypothetical protein
MLLACVVLLPREDDRSVVSCWHSSPLSQSAVRSINFQRIVLTCFSSWRCSTKVLPLAVAALLAAVSLALSTSTSRPASARRSCAVACHMQARL